MCETVQHELSNKCSYIHVIVLKLAIIIATNVHPYNMYMLMRDAEARKK